MPPVVTEVVDIGEVDAAVDDSGELGALGVQDRPHPIPLRIGNAVVFVTDLELVEVSVLPAHHRLDGVMKTLKADRQRHLDPPPDGRFDIVELHPQAGDSVGGGHVATISALRPPAQFERYPQVRDGRGSKVGAQRYNASMELQTTVTPLRRPRFRRAAAPPAFRLTDDDLVIVRQLARHRFLRSTHIATLVGRSLDRTNDRLSRLFHAGYLDRPRAQLDYYPTSGSAPMVYALADRGARLLIERDGVDFANVEWSRKNREAGRPFIEHQLEVMDFYVAMQCAAGKRDDVRLIHPDEMVAAFPDQSFSERNPFALRVRISHRGLSYNLGIVPDLVFGLRLADGSRRNFMVEIDRGTMPITRANLSQTSIVRKMQSYLSAHAAKQHERQFGWKTFRVLVVTTDRHRVQSMKEALRRLDVARSASAALFFFATRAELSGTDPLLHAWSDGNGSHTYLS